MVLANFSNLDIKLVPCEHESEITSETIASSACTDESIHVHCGDDAIHIDTQVARALHNCQREERTRRMSFKS